MNKKVLNILIAISVLALIALLLSDLVFDGDDEASKELNVDQQNDIESKIDTTIYYVEDNPINLNYNLLSGIDIIDNSIYLSADSSIIIIDSNYNIISKIAFNDKPKNVKLRNDSLFVLFDNHFSIFNKENELLRKSEPISDISFFSAFDIKTNKVFVADAMERKVHVFSLNAEKLYSFEGRSKRESISEFVIPSPFFHLEIDSRGELWVANPGIHRLQNYSEIGELKKSWGVSSMKVHGFSSCCNPAYFRIYENGNFLTSEKSNVRVKVYDSEGNFLYRIASAKELEIKKKAPQPAIDGDNNIYLLDFENKQLRIFKYVK